MRMGVLDIGSNTGHLLVVDAFDLIEIERDQYLTLYVPAANRPD